MVKKSGFMQLKKGKYVLGIALSCLFGACDGGVKLNQYGAYLNQSKNGLKQTIENQSVQWTATYQPIDYLAACASDGAPQDSAQTAYLGMQYFILELSDAAGVGIRKKMEQQLGEGAYSTQLPYYQFGMQPDLKLVCGRDTLPCAMHHLEQNGQVEHKMRFLLGFKDKHQWLPKQIPSNLQLEYYDKNFQRDTIRFTFKQEALHNLLAVKL